MAARFGIMVIIASIVIIIVIGVVLVIVVVIVIGITDDVSFVRWCIVMPRDGSVKQC